MFKVSKKITETMSNDFLLKLLIDQLAQKFIQQKFACSRSTLETLEKDVKYIQHYSGVSIVNFEYISHLFLVLL